MKAFDLYPMSASLRVLAYREDVVSQGPECALKSAVLAAIASERASEPPERVTPCPRCGRLRCRCLR